MVNMLEHLTFGIVDYCVCAFVLALSAGIGIYFGLFKKQNSVDEYFLGGRRMSVFPVALSLVASYVSAITIISLPAEVYTYGSQYMLCCVTGLVVCYITGKIYLPVFYELKVTSSYEYLSLRYNSQVRRLVSIVSAISLFLAIPIVTMSPVIAVNLVTGIDTTYINFLIGFVCVFYTSMGGLRAVIWSDAIQFIAMTGGIFLVIVLGIPLEGGISKVWEKATESGRTEFFNFNPNPYERMTFWTLTFGMGISWIGSMGINQTCIQRFLSVPSINDARKTLYIYAFGILLLKAICLLSGLVIFARYNTCDPLSVGIVAKADQIVPYYIMDISKYHPGLPGIFVAGLLSASLSTISTLLNTLGGILYQDVIAQMVSTTLSDHVMKRIMVLLVAGCGVICTAMHFVVNKGGSIMDLTFTLTGLVTGPLLGVFTIGMFSKRVNSKGVMAGILISFVLMSWISIGNLFAKRSGALMATKKPFSVSECIYPLTHVNQNLTNHTSNSTIHEDIFFLYKISNLWYSLIGLTLMMIISVVVSLMTEPPSRDQIKPEYFTPIMRTYLFSDESCVKGSGSECEKMHQEMEIFSKK